MLASMKQEEDFTMDDIEKRIAEGKKKEQESNKQIAQNSGLLAALAKYAVKKDWYN